MLHWMLVKSGTRQFQNGRIRVKDCIFQTNTLHDRSNGLLDPFKVWCEVQWDEGNKVAKKNETGARDRETYRCPCDEDADSASGVVAVSGSGSLMELMGS